MISIAGDRTRQIAAASIAVAILVMAIKYVAYVRTGSVALLSDAFESIVNVATALFALWAVSFSGKPADTNHPFGHHKAEYVSAVFTGAMIIVAALSVLYAAWNAFLAPKPPTAPLEGAGYSALATALNAGWAGFLIVKGRAWRSPALEADGWHVLSDVVTSLGVLVGFALVALTGWLVLDPLTAVIVAINILWSGLRVMRGSLGGLMDESVDKARLETIRETIRAHAGGALEVHDLKARSAAAATFIECHLVVPGTMSVREAHDICDRIEQAIRADIDGARILIHVEPEEKAKSHGALVL
jgi:cation diffusion facilitator family transporter